MVTGICREDKSKDSLHLIVDTIQYTTCLNAILTLTFVTINLTTLHDLGPKQETDNKEAAMMMTAQFTEMTCTLVCLFHFNWKAVRGFQHNPPLVHCWVVSISVLGRHCSYTPADPYDHPFLGKWRLMVPLFKSQFCNTYWLFGAEIGHKHGGINTLRSHVTRFYKT